MAGFVGRVLVAAVVGSAIEAAWTLRFSAGGARVFAVVLGANVALAAVGVLALGAVGRAVDRGWGVSAFWARARGQPRIALGADLAVVVALAAIAAQVLVAFVAAGHDLVQRAVATAAFRGPLVGGLALAAAAVLVAMGPGLVAPLRALVGRARPGAQAAVIVIVAGAGAATASAGVWTIRGPLAELDPPMVLGLAAPLVALGVGWLGGPVLARRLSKRAAAVAGAILVTLPCAAIVLTRGGSVRGAVERSALQTRLLADVLAGAAPPRVAARPGPASRLFPAWPAPNTRRRARHLVLVTIDALRADRVRHMRNLEVLADRGVRFDAAYCTVPGSLRAVPSLLTGRYANALPWRRASRVFVDPASTRTLSEALAAAGFDTVFVPHTRYVMNAGTTQGFALVVDPVLLPEADRRRNAPRDVPMVEATLAELRERRAGPRGERPLFLWSHFIDPHAPYWDHDGARGSEEVRYDAEVAASDRALGKLLAGLDELGVLDDAIVVVTADHGEELGEHGTRRHSRTTWNEAVRVPLVIAVPGVAPRRVREPVSHVDLVPTLLPLLGIEPPGDLDGRSLARTVLEGSPPPERTLIVVAYPGHEQVPASYAAVRGDHKLVTDRDGVATGLFDLKRDPGERDDRLDEADPSLVHALEADVARYRARGLGEPR